MKNILIIFLCFISLNCYSSDITDFNRNVKNYNKKLEIFSENKKITEFFVAIADDENKKQYGLMNLEKMNEKNGMLFLFEKPTIINMWMKNTIISLDMIFIDKNNQIVFIAKNTKPFSTDIISSQKKADKVLEINADLAEKLKIKIGQKIKYENF